MRSSRVLAAICFLGFGAVGFAQPTSGPWPGISGIRATADDAMTVSSNAAAMVNLTRAELLGRFFITDSDSTWDSELTGLGERESDDDSGNLYIPSLFFARPVHDRWWVGASLVVPAGFGDDFPDDSPGRYLVDEWSLVYIALSTAAAYQVNEHWSLGLGVSASASIYSLDSAVFNPGAPDGKMELDAHDIVVSWSASMLYRAGPNTRVGLSYRSEVESELKDNPSFSNLSAAAEARLGMAGLLDSDITVESRLPAMAGVGVFHRFPSGTALSFDALYLDFSRFKLSEIAILDAQLIDRGADYDDIVAVSIGANHPIGRRWRVGASVGYLPSPVTDSERTLAFRIDDTWIYGTGFDYDFGGNKKVGLNVSYMDLGDGKIESRSLPFIGVYRGEYDHRRVVLFDLRFNWRFSRDR